MPSNIVGNPNVYKATLQGSKSHPDSKSTQQGSSSFQNATPVGPEKATTALPNVTGTQEEYDSTPKLSECETQSSGEVLSSAVNAEIDADCDWTDNVLESGKAQEIPLLPPQLPQPTKKPTPKPKISDYFLATPKSGANSSKITTQRPTNVRNASSDSNSVSSDVKNTGISKHSDKTDSLTPSKRYTSFEGVLEQESLKSRADENSFQPNRHSMGAKANDRIQAGSSRPPQDGGNTSISRVQCENTWKACDPQPRSRDLNPVMTERIERPKAALKPIMTDAGSKMSRNVISRFPADGNQSDALEGNRFGRPQVEKVHSGLDESTNARDSTSRRNVDEIFNKVRRNLNSAVSLSVSTSRSRSTFGGSLWDQPPKDNPGIRAELVMNSGKSASVNKNPWRDCQIRPASSAVQSNLQDQSPACRDAPSDSAKHRNIHLKSPEEPASQDTAEDGRNLDQKQPSKSSRNPKKRWCAEAQQQSENFPSQEDVADFESGQLQSSANISRNTLKDATISDCGLLSTRTPSSNAAADSEDAFDSRPLQSTRNPCRNAVEFKPLQAKRNPSKHAVDSKDAVDSVQLQRTRNPPRHSAKTVAYSEDAVDSKPLQSTRNPCRNAVDSEPLRSNRNSSKAAVDSEDSVNFEPSQSSRNPSRNSSKAAVNSEDAVNSEPSQSSRNPSRNSSKAAVNSEDAVDSRQLRSTGNPFRNAAADSEDTVYSKPLQSARNSSKAAVDSEDAVNSEPSQSSRNPSRNSSKAAVNSEDAVDSRQLRSTGNPFRNAAADSEDAVYSKPLQSARNPSRNSSKAAVGSEDAVDSRRLQSTRNPSGYPASSETVSNRPEIAVSSPTYAQNGQISIKDVRKASVDGEHGGELQKPAPNSAINPKQSSISKARMKARNFSSQEAASELLQNSGHSSRNPASFEGTLNLGIAGDSTMLPHQGLGNSTNCSAPMWDLGDQISLSLASMDKELTNEEIDQIIASAMEIKQSYPSNQQLSGEIQKPELAKSSNEPRKDFDEHDDARNLQNPSTSFDSAERVHNLNSETKRVEESTWESQSISESSDVGSQSTHSRSAATNQLREDSDIGSNLGDIKTPLLPPFVEAFPTTSASSLGKKYEDRNQNGGRQESQKTLQSTGFKQPAQRKPLNPIHQHPSGVKNNPNLSRTRPKPVTRRRRIFPMETSTVRRKRSGAPSAHEVFVTAAELDAHAAAEGHIVCSMSEACASLSFASSAALSHHQAMVHQAPAQTTAVQRLAAQVERLPQTFGNYPPPPAAYGGPPPFSIPPAPYSGPKLGSQVVLTPMSAPVVSAPPQPNLPNLPGIQVTKRPAPPPVDSSPSKMIRGEDNVPSIRLPDSITLVKSQPAAPPQNAVADMLATRGITMVASGSRAGQAPVASIQPVTPAKRLPNVPSAISIVPSRSQPGVS
ncbi:hypothetical protein GE061_008754 [Apolygus lucorum]|uniref:Uncharacterized protein n=1 Tax=Apolygus lucorum TaxID=248454 RepID=A0A8S9WNM2_APOLU|nr:hypothetical protein GE061_008754 [Apolygus lucorum]